MKTKLLSLMAGLAVLGIAQGQTVQTTRVEKIDPDGVPVVEVTRTETLPKLAVATARAETVATVTFQGNDTIYDCPNDTIPPDGCDSVAPQAGTAPCGWWRYRKLRIYNGATCPPTNPTKFTFHVRDRCDATHYFWIGTWQPLNWTGRCDRTGYRATFSMTAQYPGCVQGDVGCNCLEYFFYDITDRGTGYSKGDILSPSGGTVCPPANTYPYQLQVYDVSPIDGSISSAALLRGIGYATPPVNPVGFSGGTGAGFKANITYQ
jgi:hypothetical protein